MQCRALLSWGLRQIGQLLLQSISSEELNFIVLCANAARIVTIPEEVLGHRLVE